MSRRAWDLVFSALHYCWPVLTVVLAYVSIPMLALMTVAGFHMKRSST